MRFCSVKIHTGPCTCHRGAGQGGGVKRSGLINVARDYFLLVFLFVFRHWETMQMPHKYKHQHCYQHVSVQLYSCLCLLSELKRSFQTRAVCHWIKQRGGKKAVNLDCSWPRTILHTEAWRIFKIWLFSSSL